MNAKQVAIATLFAFTLGVLALSAFGARFLKQIEVCDTTVSYLDLARQAAESRNYDLASEMYKQALMYARKNDPTGQSEGAMLLGYAKFAYEKKHDKQLAMALQARSQELRKMQVAASLK